MNIKKIHESLLEHTENRHTLNFFRDNSVMLHQCIKEFAKSLDCEINVTERNSKAYPYQFSFSKDGIFYYQLVNEEDEESLYVPETEEVT